MKAADQTMSLFSHSLAFGASITPENLPGWLVKSKTLGYSRMTFVPATIADQKVLTPAVLTEQFLAAGMRGQACLFITPDMGDTQNPDDHSRIIEALKPQLKYGIALHEAGLGLPMVVGPAHTTWCKQYPKKGVGSWNKNVFQTWLQHLNALAGKYRFKIALEALNSTEDGTPNAFNEIYEALISVVLRLENLLFHFDTGHALQRKIDVDLLRRIIDANKLGFIEFVNYLRRPLSHVDSNHLNQIDFQGYAVVINALLRKGGCSFTKGVEPFNYPDVIKGFGLGMDKLALCDSTHPGTYHLEHDIAYLQSIGLQ